MRHLISLFILLFFLTAATANNTKRKILRYSVAEIQTATETTKGILLSITDSTLTIIPNFSKRAFSKGIEMKTVTYHAKDIQGVQLKEKKNSAISIGVGGLIGYGTVGITGLIVGVTAEVLTLGQADVNYNAIHKVAAIGGGIGMGLGALHSTGVRQTKTTFIIGKQLSTFQLHQKLIARHILLFKTIIKQ